MTALDRIAGLAKHLNMTELAPLLVVGATGCVLTGYADVVLGLLGMAAVALVYAYFKGD